MQNVCGVCTRSPSTPPVPSRPTTGKRNGRAASIRVISLLAEDDDDAVLMTNGMACFEVPGFDDQRWIVQCMFDPGSKMLLTFSLVRSGDWVSTRTH